MGIAVVNALVFSKVVSVPFLFLYQYVQDTPTAAIMTEITDEQLEELKEAFVLYDKVGDDKIDSADVIKLLQSLTLNPLTADVKKVLEDSQLDKTRVDFPTFVSIYEQFRKRPTIANHADLMEMFKCFDREGNKMVFGGEFRQVMNNLCDVMEEKDIEFFIGPQENADGYVAYEELIKFGMNGVAQARWKASHLLNRTRDLLS